MKGVEVGWLDLTILPHAPSIDMASIDRASIDRASGFIYFRIILEGILSNYDVLIR